MTTRSLDQGDLLSGGTMAEVLSARGLDVARMTPSYVRHKPGQSLTVAYEIETGAQKPTWGYVHWEADQARCDHRWAKSLTLRPRPSGFGPGLCRLDQHAILYGLPNDARLRRLRWYTAPRKLKRALAPLGGSGPPFSAKRTSVDILRFKPERRMVAAVELGRADGFRRRVVVRYATARNAPMLAAAATHLSRHGLGVA
ncbi:MAG: hypothetical protein AAGK32_12880, partial [Actinomycetota bacterium]